ncbi:YigZ family protein [Facklamia sp. 7083-14-GEN3]|uniref:YigZ family protein n=1 Tax=Facklamia sp. 7083-14-GEN3 TaxID=2973478 RepID=UPI00215B83FB|nr:YigZ family protein [Facklamia sp. 7083-14-GEN3]MCR8969988.1 YigZ family protein [Facklamia sp. 7083-14-GEN3]
MFNYLSIQKEIIHEIEIKKSRFICYLIPIKSEEEFNQHLLSIQKKHYKANHHCYAFSLEADSSIQRMSDDGEPTGTAGLPMLEVLRQEKLTFIAAVVVRYFGGTKLGAGGLIRAYTQAVSESCQLAKKIKNVNQTILQIEIDYAQLDRFNHNLDQMPGLPSVLSTEYLEKIQMTIAIHSDHLDEFDSYLVNFFSGQVQIDNLGDRDIDMPFKK